MIVSFGYSHGPVQRASKTFDVRELTHDESDPAFAQKFQEIVTHGRANPADLIAIGCDKGVHRSRVLANKVASALRVGVYHRDR